MHIALISYEYAPYIWGGIGNYTRQAALMLQGRGHEVEIFAACPDRSYDEVAEGVWVHFGQCADRWKFSPVAARILRAAHGVRPFDVVEVPELAAEAQDILAEFPELPSVIRLHTPAYLAARVDRMSFGRTAVLLQALRYALAEVVRGRWPQNGLEFYHQYGPRAAFYEASNDEECRTARLADVLASPSSQLAADVTRDWNLPPGTVHVLPYPHQPDPAALAMDKTPGVVQTIAFYGGIKSFKGVDVLARAIPLVRRRHPEVRFVFAGSSQASPLSEVSLSAFVRGGVCRWGDMLQWLRQALAAQGAAVEFRGQLDRRGIMALLSEADLCVFPSRYDNFPNACLEAMSAAMPIVATRSGGMEEMLGPTAAGCLVAPGAVDKLAAAICWMIENPGGRQVMAQRARQRVLEAYGWEQIGPAYERLYELAINRNAAKRAPVLARSAV